MTTQNTATQSKPANGLLIFFVAQLMNALAPWVIATPNKIQVPANKLIMTILFLFFLANTVARHL